MRTGGRRLNRCEQMSAVQYVISYGVCEVTLSRHVNTRKRVTLTVTDRTSVTMKHTFQLLFRIYDRTCNADTTLSVRLEAS